METVLRRIDLEEGITTKRAQGESDGLIGVLSTALS